MRLALLVGVIPLALSTMATAHAGPSAAPNGSSLRPLVVSELPERCKQLADVPASATISDPAFAAHVSVANCRAEEAMAQVALRPDAVSIAALDAAARPSVEILDDVIAHGTARWRLLADTAKADLYRGMAVRMRVAMSGREAPTSVEASLTSWLDRASRASHDASDVAHAGSVGDDPVVRNALASLASVEPSTAGAPGLFDPMLVRKLHRAIAADEQVIKDRAHREAVRIEIAEDTHLLSLQTERIAALRAAWHRAAEGGEYGDAATLARAHFEAVRARDTLRTSLAQARTSLIASQHQLAHDRQRLRQVEARDAALRTRPSSTARAAL